MKRILVTGASGLVGTHLVQKLLEKNYSVLGLDLVDMKVKINDNRFHFAKCDLRESDEVERLFNEQELDGVINAFGIKGSPIRAKESPLDFLEPSIKVNTNIIENSHKHNCWLVFMSSVGVYEPAEVFVEDTVWKTLCAGRRSARGRAPARALPWKHPPIRRFRYRPESWPH